MSAFVDAYAPELIVIWIGVATLILSLELWTAKQRIARRPSTSFILETIGMALAWPVLLPVVACAWFFGIRR